MNIIMQYEGLESDEVINFRILLILLFAARLDSREEKSLLASA